MHGRQQNQVDLRLPQLRLLPVNRGVRTQKNKYIESDDAERNHRPAAPTHVFMAKWYQHLIGSVRTRTISPGRLRSPYFKRCAKIGGRVFARDTGISYSL